MADEKSAPPITVFVCGGARPTCYRCGSRAVKRCDAAKADGTVCGKPLCADHARGTRCAQHAPCTTHSSMPKPPTRCRS